MAHHSQPPLNSNFGEGESLPLLSTPFSVSQYKRSDTSQSVEDRPISLPPTGSPSLPGDPSTHARRNGLPLGGIKGLPSAGDLAESSGKRLLGTLAGVRSWLKMQQDGSTDMVQLERHSLERELGVQLRDFRVLDTVLGTAYPSCILVRPHCLIINLEMCKCIISRSYALINNTDADRVKPFVEALKDRLRATTGTPMRPGHPHSRSEPYLIANHPLHADSCVNDTRDPGPPHSHLKTMPFELIVLEVCLEQVLSHVDRQTAELDTGARLAIDRLLSRLTAKSLERVRLLKNRIASVQKKVTTTIELLRKLLEDDKSMAECNLTAQHEAEEIEAQRRQMQLRHHHSPLQAMHGLTAGGAGADTVRERESPQHSVTWQDSGVSLNRWGSQLLRPSQNLTIAHHMHMQQAMSPAGDMMIDSTTPAAAAAAAANLFLGGLGGMDEARLMEEGSAIVEMLLEAFYLQLDQAGSKLESCAQAIHDAEDLINIKLDQHRNQLISIDLMASIAALVLGACAVVVGVFGMNLPSGLEDHDHALISITGYMLLTAGLIWAVIIGVAVRGGVITWVPWGAERD